MYNVTIIDNQNETSEISEFVDKYCLYDGNIADVNVGIKFENNLVSLIGYKMEGNDTYEILYIGTKTNLNLINGYYNIQQKFIQLYKPNNIVANVENDFGNEFVYRDFLKMIFHNDMDRGCTEITIGNRTFQYYDSGKKYYTLN